MVDFKVHKTISDYYLAESQHVVRLHENPIVLKTDVWNEDKNEPVPGGIIFNLYGANWIYGIEYDTDRMARVRDSILKRDGPINISIQSGDIRKLPYPGRTFDVVLDLSTIDHVIPAEMPRVIQEYARVLKTGGSLLLIAWTDPNFKDEEIKNYSHTTQYYHSLNKLRDVVERLFNDTYEEILFIDKEGKELVQFLGERNTEALEA